MIIESLRMLAVPAASLNMLPGNPRVGDISAVSRSLERFGQRKPIVVLRESRMVVAGNHTLQAAMALGWKEIAAVFVDESLEEGKAFALADNRVHDLGSYLDEELLAMLQAVTDIESLGFDEVDLDDLMNRLSEIHHEPVAIPDREPEPEIDFDEFADRYIHRISKSIVLNYTAEEFIWVVDALAKARHAEGWASNSEAVIQMLESQIGAHFKSAGEEG
jgi:ParB-like chromosome segregation protein Spo0J